MMTEKDTMQAKPEKKEDRRVRRTKKLLTHGLIQLMKEKQVQDITVRELADLVDVNRGTFYLYYRDIFDMLDSIEQELLNQVNQLIAAHKGRNRAYAYTARDEGAVPSGGGEQGTVPSAAGAERRYEVPGKSCPTWCRRPSAANG